MFEPLLAEENVDLLNTENICVTLIEVTPGGLDRDVVVNVQALDETAISKQNIYF